RRPPDLHDAIVTAGAGRHPLAPAERVPAPSRAGLRAPPLSGARPADRGAPRCLGSALVAVGLPLAVLAAFDHYARGMARRSIHALASELLEQKNQGRALQAEAFRQPDLLPLYGTSELQAYQGPFHP